MMNKKYLSVKNLSVSFRTEKGILHAVRGIDFDLKKGETLAIVGESGSGKSVSAKAILGIEAENAIIESGEILYEGKNLLSFSEKEFTKIRGNKIAMVFQDPLSALDPIVKVGYQLTESMILNGRTERHLAKKELSAEIKKLSTTNKNIKNEIKTITKKYEKFFSENQNAGTDYFNAPDCFKSSEEFSEGLKFLVKKAAYKVTKKIAFEKAIKLMNEVGIENPEKRFYQYPFELSGGMRQRIVIAIAISSNPELLICDEPTTALDVTIQAQILDLIKKLKDERKMSVIFITHDLGVVANIADKIAVMYAGKIVEYGMLREIFYDSRHPYTWALLSSVPDLNSTKMLEFIPGTPPNLIQVPKGDAFAPRNKYAMQIDFEQEPPFFEITPTHKAATWLLHPDAPSVTPPEKILLNRKKLEK